MQAITTVGRPRQAADRPFLRKTASWVVVRGHSQVGGLIIGPTAFWAGACETASRETVSDREIA